MLGRIVFQAHPLVLFRSEALADDSAERFAARLLPDVYTELLEGAELSAADENRILRALAGYAFWKGRYEWIYTLAFFLLEKGRAHNSILFLASMTAAREGRPSLAAYLRASISEPTEWMAILWKGLAQSYEELGSISSSVSFFQPAARRRARAIAGFRTLRAARDAALGWFLCSGSMLSLRQALRRSTLFPLLRQADSMEEDSDIRIKNAFQFIHLEGQAGYRPGLRLALARRAMEMQDYEKADAWLNTFRGRHPRILHMRASCHRSLGELGLAALEYRHIVKRYPAEPVFVENYARILLDLGRDDEARRALEHAARLS